MLSIIFLLMLSPGFFAYDDKYERVDMEKILADDALLMSYLNCFLDKGPCDEEYAEDFKGILPEVIATACEKCTDSQKKTFRTFIKTIYEKKADVAAELRSKLDPKGLYKEKITAFMQETN